MFIKCQKVSQYLDPNTCVFCSHFNGGNRYDYGPLLSKALYSRYSSDPDSIDKYDINDLIKISRKTWVIEFRDQVIYEDIEEYLTEYYKQSSIIRKLPEYLEYYKFHQDKPRVYIHKFFSVLEYFYESYKYYTYENLLREIRYHQTPRRHTMPKREFSAMLRSLTFLKQDQSLTIQSSRILRDLVQQLGAKDSQIQTLMPIINFDLSIESNSTYKLQWLPSMRNDSNKMIDSNKIIDSNKSNKIVDSNKPKKINGRNKTLQDSRVTEEIKNLLESNKKAKNLSNSKVGQMFKQLLSQTSQFKSQNQNYQPLQNKLIGKSKYPFQYPKQNQFKSLHEEDLKNYIKTKSISSLSHNQIKQHHQIQQIQQHTLSPKSSYIQSSKSSLLMNCLQVMEKRGSTKLSQFQNKVAPRSRNEQKQNNDRIPSNETTRPTLLTIATGTSPSQSIHLNSPKFTRQQKILPQPKLILKTQHLIQEERILEMYHKWQQTFSNSKIIMQKALKSPSNQRAYTESSQALIKRTSAGKVLTEASPKLSCQKKCQNYF